MFCPNCGANVPENQAFCASCGAKMAPAAPQQTPAAKAPAAKPAITKDAMLVFRIAVVALALLSIILIFSKGMGIHFDDSDAGMNFIVEWDTFFKNCCDSSKALPITFQVISVILIVGAAASVFVPVFVPQLSKIKFYNLIPAAIAAFNLLLFVIMLIVALALFDPDLLSLFGDCGAHPASASWFYIADMIALILVSFKMYKGTK